MGIVRLSDGRRLKSTDIDSATLYAKPRGKTGMATGAKGSGKKTEDRLYVLLKNATVLRSVGKAAWDDAEKLHAAKVPVFFNKADAGPIE